MSRPIRRMAWRNSSRSSALSMASREAPISLHPVLAPAHPSRTRSSAQLRAVCPPMVGSSASGRSRSMMLRQGPPGHRLDVGGIGHLRVGHDGGRIGVHQDDPVALFPQGLAGLGAGVVELTGLADDDRTRADDQDAVDVGSFGHFLVASPQMNANERRWTRMGA